MILSSGVPQVQSFEVICHMTWYHFSLCLRDSAINANAIPRQGTVNPTVSMRLAETWRSAARKIKATSSRLASSPVQYLPNRSNVGVLCTME